MITVNLKVNIADPAALHAAAVTAYTRNGADEADALAFLGTADAPKWENVLAEIICENMDNSAFGLEFPGED